MPDCGLYPYLNKTNLLPSTGAPAPEARPYLRKTVNALTGEHEAQADTEAHQPGSGDAGLSHWYTKPQHGQHGQHGMRAIYGKGKPRAFADVLEEVRSEEFYAMLRAGAGL